jgi:hypothetical protein
MITTPAALSRCASLETSSYLDSSRRVPPGRS